VSVLPLILVLASAMLGVGLLAVREALESLDGVEIVLLDHQLPDASGLDILEAIRARPNPPAVVALAAAERDLVRAERLAAIGEMTVTLHHGINNPLMAASADIEMLLADPGMPETQRRCRTGRDQAGRAADDWSGSGSPRRLACW
jgi:CheY-like chemotaxis protein